MMQTKKTILFGMPTDHSIYRMIEDNLKYLGFHVISIAYNHQEFNYPSITSRLKIKFQQIVLRDLHAKQKLKTSIFQPIVAQQLSLHPEIDWALFIRADIYDTSLLKFIKNKISGGMVNYQWDGLDRYPDIKKCMNVFDRFYIFDPADLDFDENLLPACNFYFDHNLHMLPDDSSGMYFIGTHMPERIHAVNALCAAARQAGWHTNFHVGWFGRDATTIKNLYMKEVDIFHESKSFEENQLAAQQAKVLVDFKTPTHNGLSFRIFESIGYEKKLITTNAEVKKYDFFHPNNIFVWDGKNLDGLADFLSHPYCPLDNSIRLKYSFSNWIKYLLDIHPHQKLKLPRIPFESH